MLYLNRLQSFKHNNITMISRYMMTGNLTSNYKEVAVTSGAAEKSMKIIS